MQAIDADVWFGTPPEGSALPRWRPRSNYEPIVDGIAYFDRLVPDLRSAKNGGGAYFAGWAFIRDKQLEPVPWSLIPGDDSTRPIPLLKELVSANTEVRLLVNDMLQIADRTLNDGGGKFKYILAALFAAAMPLNAVGFLATDLAGFGVLLLGIAVSAFILETTTLAADKLEGFAEISKSFVEEMEKDSALAGLARWSAYPAAGADNPLLGGLVTLPGLGPIDDVKRFGAYHQKMVVIRRPDGEFLAYTGGMDISSDRVDSPLHRSVSPFHDVQVRLTGPAAADVATSFRERIIHDSGSVSYGSGPTVSNAGTHLVQVARTYFVPRAGSGTAPFAFAPKGERLIFDTMIKAIDQARDYIYIEDQYFTPASALVSALLSAGEPSRGVRALVITLPPMADQPFGDIRKTSVLAKLVAKWGNRLKIGAPIRRYLSPTPANYANLGRTRLAEDMDLSERPIKIERDARIPQEPPFWAFVGHELVYFESVVGPADADGNRSFNIKRGTGTGGPKWGASVRTHAKATPVYFVRIPGIYVHAKLMIVDDVFVGIGSANLNRRGHFHDGEMNAFCVPQHLRRDAKNPARELRCRLWAEHFGLSGEMGLSLLADPIAALSYFDRTWYAGSRWQPLTATTGAPALAWPVGVSDSIGGLVLNVLLGGAVGVLMESLWKGVVAPTTGLDPAWSKAGPEVT